MVQKEKLQLVIEQLEERIAPGGVDVKNNNGYGNGPEAGDGPGHSGDSPKFGDAFNANFGGNTDAPR
jgi:hypothetical protein